MEAVSTCVSADTVVTSTAAVWPDTNSWTTKSPAAVRRSFAVTRITENLATKLSQTDTESRCTRIGPIMFTVAAVNTNIIVIIVVLGNNVSYDPVSCRVTWIVHKFV